MVTVTLEANQRRIEKNGSNHWLIFLVSAGGTRGVGAASEVGEEAGVGATAGGAGAGTLTTTGGGAGAATVSSLSMQSSIRCRSVVVHSLCKYTRGFTVVTALVYFASTK